jgi:hypothetical protein
MGRPRRSGRYRDGPAAARRLRGGLFCRRWWLGLDWPYLVTEFLARLEDPTRWGSPAMVRHVQDLAPPTQATDLDDRGRLLLAGPDRMNTETADYCLHAGIGHLLPHDYHRPPRPRQILLNAVLPLIAPVARSPQSAC